MTEKVGRVAVVVLVVVCVLQTLFLAAKTPEEPTNIKEKNKKRVKTCFDICFMLSL